MEEVGDKVFYFGVASGIGCALLCTAFLYYLNIIRHPTESMILDSIRTRSGNCFCVICLGESEFALETNCGHVYCGNCILEVCCHSSTVTASPSPCPYCRQRITSMLPFFSDTEKNSSEPADTEIRTKIKTYAYIYNRRFSVEPKSVIEQVRDLPMLVRNLVVYLFNAEDLHLAFDVRCCFLSVVWLVYLLSPLDLLPEAVFGLIGLIDDLVIFLLITMYLTFFFRQIMSTMDTVSFATTS